MTRVILATRRDLLREAIGSLMAHRLRAALSVLGIVLGIATVIAALAIGEGARRAALSEIGALGVDNILVRAVAPEPSRAPRQRRAAPALTIGDAEVIAASLGGISAIACTRVTRTEIRSDRRRAEAALAGVTTPWKDVFGATVGEGRWLAADDQREHRRVAVIGAALARELFGDRPAVGSRVMAAGGWFLVVGALAPDDARRSGTIAREFDPAHALFVPLAAMDVSVGSADDIGRVHEIAVRIARSEDVESAAMAIAAVASRMHGGGGYELVVPRQLLASRLRARRTFDVVLVAVGGIALLISGVGIMNIMLASVAERTHEIGVRRAVGARRSDVIAQFTAEASLLCLAGAGAGVPLGVVMAVAVAAIGGWPVDVSLWSVGLATVLAVATGLTSGLYPARLAARISPVDALRAE